MHNVESTLRHCARRGGVASAQLVLRGLSLALALFAGPAWAAEDIQQQARRIEAALARISQEQQTIYQQFQMVQELRRNDERQPLPLQNYLAPTTPPNYDDVRRMEEARAQRIRDHQYEVDRLYARYRELEEQKKPLLETLSVLAQQRSEAQPPRSPQDLPNEASAGAPPGDRLPPPR